MVRERSSILFELLLEEFYIELYIYIFLSMEEEILRKRKLFHSFTSLSFSWSLIQSRCSAPAHGHTVSPLDPDQEGIRRVSGGPGWAQEELPADGGRAWLWIPCSLIWPDL